jgi:hypothetical protein
MATVSTAYTFTGSEYAGRELSRVPMPSFTGSYTLTWTATAQPGGSGPWFPVLSFWKNSTATACRQFTPTISGTTTTFTVTETVNATPPQWHCLDWDYLTLGMQTAGPAPAGVVWGLTVDAAGIAPPSPCAYGTRAQATWPDVLVLTPPIILEALGVISAEWAYVIFAGLVGLSVSVSSICSLPPPSPIPINSDTLLDTVANKIDILYSLIWWGLCECVPGTPSPTPYPPPTVVKPPNWDQPLPAPCTNSDICATLLEIIKRLDALAMSQTVSIDQRTTVYSSPLNLHYTLGTPFTVTGSGTHSLPECVGIRYSLTGTPPQELPGVPPYQWNRGWMSVTDGGPMLQEKRLTRAAAEWFPPEMQLADSLGYYLNPGVTCTFTPLLRQ